MPNCANSVIPSNNAYILYGETRDSNNFLRVSITKIDTAGNQLWGKSYGRQDSNYESIFSLGEGGALVTWGGFAGVGMEDNTNRSNFRLALYRFDNNGDTIWTKVYYDTASLMGWNIKVARIFTWM